MYKESQSQLSLFGHQEIFNILNKLQIKKKLPNKIILSGEKGIGKCTLAYHLINCILSTNEDYNYDIKDYDLKSFLKLVIKDNLYKKDALIKDIIFQYFEFYFLTKVKFAKLTTFEYYYYFLKNKRH